MATADVIHIAGPDITVDGHRLRQRCCWCGAIIIDVDLHNVAVKLEEGETEGRPYARWQPGSLVRVVGDNPKMFDRVDPELVDGEPKLPDDCCAYLDDAVTA